ncbi:MAG TPA: hypothetical protein VLN59_18035, partial [Burkholderiales bacterium]|nr:hypothetical protein [Burkholderiales bacterium]
MTTTDSRADLEQAIARVLQEHVPGFRALRACERLSGGASQETYRILLETNAGERKLAMRRALGGTKVRLPEAGPGLAVEARLMRAARAVGVPEPEIVHVFEESDRLGEGFLMEWLEGET